MDEAQTTKGDKYFWNTFLKLISAERQTPSSLLICRLRENAFRTLHRLLLHLTRISCHYGGLSVNFWLSPAGLSNESPSYLHLSNFCADQHSRKDILQRIKLIAKHPSFDDVSPEDLRESTTKTREAPPSRKKRRPRISKSLRWKSCKSENRRFSRFWLQCKRFSVGRSSSFWPTKKGSRRTTAGDAAPDRQCYDSYEPIDSSC
jgi:hypothetical protein